MSQATLEGRVGELETGQARQEVRLGRIESDVGKIGTGVEKLLERDARRPQSLSWQSVAATCIGIAGVAAVGWWLIGTAPAVQDLDKRVSRLDDPEFGRVPRVEKRLHELEAWQPRITRY